MSGVGVHGRRREKIGRGGWVEGCSASGWPMAMRKIRYLSQWFSIEPTIQTNFSRIYRYMEQHFWSLVTWSPLTSAKPCGIWSKSTFFPAKLHAFEWKIVHCSSIGNCADITRSNSMAIFENFSFSALWSDFNLLYAFAIKLRGRKWEEMIGPHTATKHWNSLTETNNVDYIGRAIRLYVSLVMRSMKQFWLEFELFTAATSRPIRSPCLRSTAHNKLMCSRMPCTVHVSGGAHRYREWID